MEELSSKPETPSKMVNAFHFQGDSLFNKGESIKRERMKALKKGE